MQEITLADGAELAVAEEACQAHRAEALLDQVETLRSARKLHFRGALPAPR